MTGAVGLVLGLVIGVAAGDSSDPTTAVTAAPSEATSPSPVGSGPSPSPESPAESPTEATEPSGELGSRENPIPLGDAGSVGDNWEITVTSVNEDADEAIHKANLFNEKPAEGRQYVMVTVRAKYLGGGKGDVYFDLTYGASGDSGTVYEAAQLVLPEDLSNANALFGGDAAEGNVAFEVEKSQIPLPRPARCSLVRQHSDGLRPITPSVPRWRLQGRASRTNELAPRDAQTSRRTNPTATDGGGACGGCCPSRRLAPAEHRPWGGG